MTDLALIVPPIVGNARRLLADADLLAENERHASAFVLATLSLEEIGKVVLLFWGADPAINVALKGASKHVQKQSAAAVLLLADLAHAWISDRAKGAGLQSAREIPDSDVPAAVHALAEVFYISGEAHLFEMAAAGVLDVTKQAGLYVDSWFVDRDLTHAEFDASDTTRAREDARRALGLLNSIEKLSLARILLLTSPVKDRLKHSRKASGTIRPS